ncbi:PAS domain-containing protein [Curvibacter sp. RS43]|uniref:PAS domain-containing protein n=1 Tax=Curvibacter microcysteis TaxID=3026419 RepID=UPI002360F821|nr:PAS domain-containing protein [Curvibacter sp. RS43]MDD0809414.1 PAS domain-containing protein [Curvibacter sp. RS43]
MRFHLPGRFRLLLLNIAVALLLGGVAWTSFRVLDAMRLGQPWPPPSRSSKDLASELLLPSLYVTESYLLCFELGSSPDRDPQKRLITRLEKLQANYQQSYQHWSKAMGLGSAQLQQLYRNANQSAQQLLRLAVGPFSQAVLQGRREEQQQLLAELTVLFEKHRRELNETAQEARKSEQGQENWLATYVEQQRFWLGLELGTALVLSLLLGAVMQHSVLPRWRQRLLNPPPDLAAGTPPTEPPRAELARGPTSPWLAALVDPLPLIVVGVDERGDIVLFNQAAENFAGLGREQALGQSWMALSATLEPTRTQPPQPNPAFGEAARHELTDRSGARRRIVWRSSPPCQIPSPWGASSVVQINVGIDLSEPQWREGQDLQAAAAPPVEALTPAPDLAWTTHLQALKNPLNTVLGLGSLALRQASDEAQRHTLKRLNLAAQALHQWLDSAKVLGMPQPFCLLDTLDDLLTSTVLQADEQGLHLEQEVPDQVTTALVGDASYLLSILRRVVDHAMACSGPGVIQLSVAQLSTQADTVALRFAVRVPQARDATEPQSPWLAVPTRLASPPLPGGGPLDLPQHMVGPLGGRLWVEPCGDTGLQVLFTAVFAKASARQIQQLTTSVTLTPRRLLVLEPDPDAREILQQVLGAWQIPVQGVATPQAASDALAQAEQEGHPFQTLLLALEPGAVEPWTWLQSLRGVSPQTTLLERVALTTAPPSQVLQTAQRMGLRLDQVLEKPIRPHALLTALRHLQANRSQAASTP